MLSPSAGPTCTDLDVTKATQEVPKVTNPSTEGFVFFSTGLFGIEAALSQYNFARNYFST